MWREVCSSRQPLPNLYANPHPGKAYFWAISHWHSTMVGIECFRSGGTLSTLPGIHADAGPFQPGTLVKPLLKNAEQRFLQRILGQALRI